MQVFIELCEPLKNTSKKSLVQLIFPGKLNIACLTSILKGGESDVSNSRSVQMLPYFSKTLVDFIKILRFVHLTVLFPDEWLREKYGFSSGPYFPAFGLNTDIYSINPRIQSKYWKIRIRKNSVFGLFLYSGLLSWSSHRLITRSDMVLTLLL